MSEQPNSSGASQSNTNKEDEELTQLLDDALKDFKDRPRTTDDELDEIMAARDQIDAQKAAADFQMMLQQMVQVQEEAVRKAQEQGNQAASPEDETEAKMMIDMMKQLMESSSEVANASSNEELLEKLGKLNSEDSPMEPFMAMMMQTLASKAVMYPPLKDIYNKYPKYFEENGASLDEETRKRYEAQYEVLGKICAEYEKQPDEPTPGIEPPVNTPAEPGVLPPDLAQFETFGKLLVELQTYGLPPKEITGTPPEGWSVDEATGLPKVDNMTTAAESCSIM